MTSSPRFDRRNPTQRRARVTHDAILEATARVLAEGQEQPSTNLIAKVAGVSVGTLYQYFDNREAIIRALCRRHTDEMTTLIVAHAGPLGTAPPAVAVPGFIDALAAAHAVAPALHLALTRETLVDASLIRELEGPAYALVKGWLELHRDAIRPRDLTAAASLLTRTVEAAIHGQLFEDPRRLSESGWRAELVDLLLRYLLP